MPRLLAAVRGSCRPCLFSVTKWLVCLGLLAVAGPDADVRSDEGIELEEARRLLARGYYTEAGILAQSVLEASRRDEVGPGALAEVIDVVTEALYQDGWAFEPKVKELASEAVRLKEEAFGTESLEYAVSLDRLADLLWWDCGPSDDALAMYEQALEIRERRLPPDHPQIARSLGNIAYLMSERTEHHEALELHQRALAIWRARGESLDPAFGDVLDWYAWSLIQSGKSVIEAKSLAEEGLHVREATLGPDHPLTAQSYSTLGDIAKMTGEYSAASEFYRRQLEINEARLRPGHYHSTTARQTLSNTLFLEGQLADALDMAEQAVEIAGRERGEQGNQKLVAIGFKARILSAMGYHDEAMRLHEEVLAVRERSVGPDHLATGVSSLHLAREYMIVGRFDEAVPLLERSLAIFEWRTEPGIEAADTRCQLARALHEVGRTEEAHDHYERALREFESFVGFGSTRQSQCLERYGRDLVRELQWEKAREVLDRAYEIQSGIWGPESVAVSGSLGQLGYVSLAAHETKNTLAIWRQVDDVERERLRLEIQGLTEYQALRRVADARASTARLVSLAVSNPSKPFVEAAWDAVIRSRALVLDEMAARLRPAGAGTDVQATAKALRAARERLARLALQDPSELGRERHAEALESAAADKERAERMLAVMDARFRWMQADARVGLRNVVDSLPDGSSLVAFLQYMHEELPADPEHSPSEPVPSYVAFVLSGTSSTPELVNLGPADSIVNLVSEWREQVAGAPPLIAGPRNEAEARYESVGTSLREVVWDPIAPLIEDAGRVLLVPDGELSLVSFGTLPAVSGGYLIESAPPIQYLSTERDVAVFSDPTPPRGSLLAVGGPDYDASPDQLMASRHTATTGTPYRGIRSACTEMSSLRFGALPGSQFEVEAVSDLWRSLGRPRAGSHVPVVQLVGVEANEAAFKALAPGRTVLHVATHGFYLGESCHGDGGATRRDVASLSLSELDADGPTANVFRENPLVLSGLVFAGANQRVRAPAHHDDGILTAEEIASLDLSRTKLAVLSACVTGQGPIVSGEGVLGLRRAFRLAGVETLVMSLWPVRDDRTVRWMEQFYRALLDGRSTVEATNRAALETIRELRDENRSTHPSSWGAFISAGNWR